jgi:hypothetical protein
MVEGVEGPTAEAVGVASMVAAPTAEGSLAAMREDLAVPAPTVGAGATVEVTRRAVVPPRDLPPDAPGMPIATPVLATPRRASILLGQGAALMRAENRPKVQ